jgi:glycosyltransferase involved in cell wall biosynthesis
MNVPILLGVDGQAREIVEQYNAGLFFEPENEEAFLAAVRKLVYDRKLRAKLSAGCETLANAYDRNRLAQEALAILEDVVGRRESVSNSV